MTEDPHTNKEGLLCFCSQQHCVPIATAGESNSLKEKTPGVHVKVDCPREVDTLVQMEMILPGPEKCSRHPHKIHTASLVFFKMRRAVKRSV